MKFTILNKSIGHIALQLFRNIIRPDTIAAVVIIVTVIAVTINTSSVILQNYKLEREVKVMEQKVRLAKLELETKKSRNNYYATDYYLDIATRKLLGKGAPGEKMIIVPREIARKELPDESKQSEEPPNDFAVTSNFQQWLGFIQGELN